MFRLVLSIRRQLIRDAVETLLRAQPDFEVVAHCVGERLRSSAAERFGVDCVIWAYNRLDGNQDTFCREIALERRGLVITERLTYEELCRLRSVAAGIVPDTGRSSEFFEAIRAVAKGHTWKDLVLLDGSAALGPSPTRAPLTDRQRLVLHYVCEGCSNKQIANDMGVSYPSVKATVQQLFEKLGVRTRSQLVRVSLERLGTTGLPLREHYEPADVCSAFHSHVTEGRHD
jgi:two-component system, NarL family, nitrate/nitrite response regulator NarL